MRAILGLLSALLTLPLAALDVGQQAPPLDAVQWVKGEPAAAGGGRVTVVEFWATWCAPCRESIPHLSDLQAKYADRVTVIGLSDEPRDTVEPYVTKMGERMAYRVGVVDRATRDAWMQGLSGIPHAFVVGGDGTVLWTGHPMLMDDVLAAIAAGTFDAGATAEVAKLEAELQAMFQGEGDGEPDLEKALALARRILDADPGNATGIRATLTIARDLGRHDALDEVLTSLPIDRVAATSLNAIAWELLTTDDLSWREPAHAIRLARAAHDKAPKDPSITDTWARALYELGLLDRAIDVEREALAAAQGETRTQLARTLDYYQTMRSLQATATAPSSAPTVAPPVP